MYIMVYRAVERAVDATPRVWLNSKPESKGNKKLPLELGNVFQFLAVANMSATQANFTHGGTGDRARALGPNNICP